MNFLFAPVCGDERPTRIAVNGVDPNNKKMDAMTQDVAPSTDGDPEDAVKDLPPVTDVTVEARDGGRGCMPQNPTVYMDNLRQSLVGRGADEVVLPPVCPELHFSSFWNYSTIYCNTLLGKGMACALVPPPRILPVSSYLVFGGQAATARRAEEKILLREELRSENFSADTCHFNADSRPRSEIKAEREREEQELRSKNEAELSSPFADAPSAGALRRRITQATEKAAKIKEEPKSSLNFADVSALRQNAAAIQEIREF